ncbi:hypothetical protein AQUCO_00400800v1 [Aquilegia coerulea]|uniref:F-box domain-containing protein n=1 Tax=Aquilegia coerulea TaxID=218851 RepID=A0A2G5EWX0_AQUCA|nr:hypothetical protein AQUCO_00400800v1 [Aquilegia coerulea]
MVKEKKQKVNETCFQALSNDLLSSIFIKCPAKSLCRFKCLSKYWYSLIQNQVFIEERQEKLYEWEIEDEDGLHYYTIEDKDGLATHKRTHVKDHSPLSYCNGLICFNGGCHPLSVFNLTTKKLVHLSYSQYCYNFEFGFDHLSKKYKILGWGVYGSSIPLAFQVLTLVKNSSWRRVKNRLGLSRPLGQAVVNAYGRFFWLQDDGKEVRIISFNLANEKFGIIKVPNMIKKENFRYYVFKFEGSLCWVQQAKCSLESIDIWMLKSTRDSVWAMITKTLTLPLRDTNLQLHNSTFSFLAALSGEMLVVTSDRDERYIFMYSFLNGQFKRIKVTGLNLSGRFSVHNHVKNYVSLKNFV